MSGLRTWEELTPAERIARWDAEEAGLAVEPLTSGSSSQHASRTRSTGFTADKLRWIEQLTLDPSLSRGALRIGLRLASYLSQKAGYAWPSQETLARELYISERAVKYGIAELRSKGHLTVHRSSRRASNRYRPIIKGAGAGSPIADFEGQSPCPSNQTVEGQGYAVKRGSRRSPNTIEGTH